MIIGIVCVDKNWGIGKKNDLLFHLKKDMQFFKDQTTESIVVCGYNTLLSFPGSKPLKGRSTICLCPEEIERDDCYCIHNFEEMVKLVTELAKTQNVYIIGGAMLYKSMLPYYDKIFVTHVDADGEAEVFFPNLREANSGFKLVNAYPTYDGDYHINFCTYAKESRNESNN